MFVHHNPYQPTVDALEEAIAAWERAAWAAEELPFGRGGREIIGPLIDGKTRLLEMHAAAQMWRDAFEHHVGRTDF